MRGVSGYPPDFGVTLDHATRRPSPQVLVGGSPLRVMRLGGAGRRLLDAWLAGDEVGTNPGAQRLARRLVDSGVAHPVTAPGRGPSLKDVTVVVPVRDRPEGLSETLEALSAVTAGGVTVLAVDDGSADPVRPEVPVRPGVSGGTTKVVRRPTPGGPAAARNTGWRMASTEIVVFLDADCVPAAGWLPTLLAHFADEAVAAVAPRVVSRPGPGVLSLYETLMSPLDLGGAGARVRPNTRVSYVPTACLAVRRSALEDTGGFDEQLRFGEDVDLVWRLDSAGWSVRFEPGAVVAHPPRASARSWARQRFDYGRSAARLASRHPRNVAPVALSDATALVLALAGSGHPGAAVGAAGGVSGAVALSAGRDAPTRKVVFWAAARGNLLAARSVATAVRRTWSLLLALVAIAAPSRALRRRIASWLAIALAWPLADWFGAARSADPRPEIGPATWTLLRSADDLAYQAGVWTGVFEQRSLRAVIPRWAGRGGESDAGR